MTGQTKRASTRRRRTPSVWRRFSGTFSHGASPFAGATEAATGQEPGACRANQSSPEAFGRLALEEFVAEQLFPGLPFDKGAPHGSPGPGMNRLLDRVRRFSAFGATFDSLQAGLAVQIDAASHEEVELGRGVVKPDRASSNHPSEQAGALLALEGIRGGRKRNVVARIVGSGRFQGIDARIGRVGLLFVSLLFRSCREEVMDDERWTVVEHGEVVDEWARVDRGTTSEIRRKGSTGPCKPSHQALAPLLGADETGRTARRSVPGIPGGRPRLFGVRLRSGKDRTASPVWTTSSALLLLRRALPGDPARCEHLYRRKARMVNFAGRW